MGRRVYALTWRSEASDEELDEMVRGNPADMDGVLLRVALFRELPGARHDALVAELVGRKRKKPKRAP